MQQSQYSFLPWVRNVVKTDSEPESITGQTKKHNPCPLEFQFKEAWVDIFCIMCLKCLTRPARAAKIHVHYEVAKNLKAAWNSNFSNFSESMKRYHKAEMSW